MSEAQARVTYHYAEFAGRRRKFELRLGEAAELERLTNAGIGEIMVRLASHTFRVADIRETIRLGLEGGGASESEATALVMRYVDGAPLAAHIELAANIVGAYVNGIDPEETQAKKDAAESATAPATSPPSTLPGQ